MQCKLTVFLLLTSSMPGILLTDSFFKVVCTFLPSVVAVRWTTFFFLRAVPWNTNSIWTTHPPHLHILLTFRPFTFANWKLLHKSQIGLCSIGPLTEDGYQISSCCKPKFLRYILWEYLIRSEGLRVVSANHTWDRGGGGIWKLE